MPRAYIGLGSNLGDRQTNLKRALNLLDADPRVRVAEVSPFLETDPVGGPGSQPRFLNAAAALDTDLQPLDLLDLLQDVEHHLGRHRAGFWDPRPIDLDLLLYDRRVVAAGRLNVPHLRFRERRFVLEPLAAIAPDAVDPITGLTVGQLLERLGA